MVIFGTTCERYHRLYHVTSFNWYYTVFIGFHFTGSRGAYPGHLALMKILSGVEQPTQGDIFLNGKKIHISDPNTAHRLGISTVYQELVQFPDMTVAENIFLAETEKYKNKVNLYSTLKELEGEEVFFTPNFRDSNEDYKNIFCNDLFSFFLLAG